MADALPIIAGYVPFGLLLGARIAASSLPPVLGWMSSPLVFAGAAQLAMVELLDAGAAPLVIVATALVINARLVVYSAAVGQLVSGSSRGARLAIAMILTDPVYALATSRLDRFRQPRGRTNYLLGVGAVLWVGWMTLTAAGMVVGNLVPAHLPLDLAVPLTFIALVVPMLTDRATVASAVTAGSVAVVARDVPLHLGLLLATATGILVGTIVSDRRTS